MENDSVVHSPDNSTSGSNTASPREIRVFICYRRSDGAWHADWLDALLDGQEFFDEQDSPCRIKTYFDQKAPGVADWKQHHFPSLEAAHALLLVCSPGVAKNTSESGQQDWVYEEIEWWLANRNTAPIVVDSADDGHRWMPKPISARWPNINRLQVRQLDAQAAEKANDRQYAKKIRSRIVSTVREQEHATVYENLEREKTLTQQLVRQTKRLKFALSATAAISVLAGALAWYSIDQGNRAREELLVANETNGIITRLFSAADPDHKFGPKLSAGALLQTGTVIVDRQDYKPRVRSRLLRSIGGAYIGMGDADKALELLKKSEYLAAQTEISAHEEFQLTLAIGEAYLIYEDDRFEKAEQPLLKAHAMAEQIYGEQKHQDVSSALVALADFMTWTVPEKLERAFELYREALEIDQALGLPSSVARDQHRLGTNAFYRGELVEADRWFEKAIASLKDGTAPLLYAQILHERAAIHFEQASLNDALLDYREARRILIDVYNIRHPQVAEANNSLGRVLIEMGRIDEAIEVLSHAVDVQEKTLGDPHAALVWSRNNLGLALLLSGKDKLARTEFSDAIGICQTQIADGDDPICKEGELRIHAQAMTHLGEIYLRENELAPAAKWFGEAREVFEELGMESGWRFAIWQSAMGELFVRQCKLEQARAELSQAHTVVLGRWKQGSPLRSIVERRILMLDQAEKQDGSCS